MDQSEEQLFSQKCLLRMLLSTVSSSAYLTCRSVFLQKGGRGEHLGEQESQKCPRLDHLWGDIENVTGKNVAKDGKISFLWAGSVVNMSFVI